MVIDDSLAVRRIVEAVMMRAGMDVISFPDGVTAIRALESRDAPIPDLLLLDIGLPKMNGYEVAGILQSNPDLHDIPILMLSGRDGLRDHLHSRWIGARDYIAKPFHSGDLLRRVQRFLPHDPPLDPNAHRSE
jgi:twitching motility two-component system response regulator PilG